jgi:hypothetical protein
MRIETIEGSLALRNLTFFNVLAIDPQDRYRRIPGAIGLGRAIEIIDDYRSQSGVMKITIEKDFLDQAPTTLV